jgi:DNA-directed RNA polymerase specialized sigma24 family protein
MPRDEVGLTLRARLLAGDTTASSDVVDAYLDDLADWLEKQYERTQPDDCLTAAEDAILGFIKNPMSYEPERKSLRNYLRMSADGDMKNLLKKERRHSERRLNQELSDPVVEKQLQDKEADPYRVLERRAETAAVDAKVRSLVPNWLAAGSTPEEIQVLGLLRIRERRTRVYAAALGISHLSFKEQQEEVKRAKDRLKKRERTGGQND